MMTGPKSGTANMIDDLTELQRRLLSRQQQYYTQCATSNGIALVAAIVILGIVFVLAVGQRRPPELGISAGYAASYLGSDREIPAQGEPSQDMPANP